MASVDHSVSHLQGRVPFGRTMIVVSVMIITASTILVSEYFSARASLFGAAGFLIGLWGMGISIVGFAYTIIQLRRTQSATEAVRAAVSSLKLRATLIDVASDTSKTIKLLETTLIHLKHNSWTNAASSLWEAQSALYRIHSALDMPDQDLALARKSASDFLLYVQELEDLAEKKVKIFDQRDMVLAIRSLINILDNAVIKSQKELVDA